MSSDGKKLGLKRETLKVLRVRTHVQTGRAPGDPPPPWWPITSGPCVGGPPSVKHASGKVCAA